MCAFVIMMTFTKITIIIVVLFESFSSLFILVFECWQFYISNCFSERLECKLARVAFNCSFQFDNIVEHCDYLLHLYSVVNLFLAHFISNRVYVEDFCLFCTLSFKRCLLSAVCHQSFQLRWKPARVVTGGNREQLKIKRE